MSKAPSIALTGAAGLLAGLLVGCSSSGGSAAAGSGSAVAGTSDGATTASVSPSSPTSSVGATPSTVSRPATSSAAATTSAVPAPGSSAYSSKLSVGVSEPADGTTLTVNRGADVVVVLHSTYWQFQQASDPHVLVQAPPEIQGDPPTGPGGPGSGRGTARETYHARLAGTATITATRTTCGEAMRCTAAQSLYRLTVIVR